jgi:hypothetical protein
MFFNVIDQVELCKRKLQPNAAESLGKQNEA